MSRIIPRSEWRARYQGGWASAARRNALPVKVNGRGGGVWLHHSVAGRPPNGATLAQDIAVVRALENIGQARFKGGISYTAVVCPSGRIFEGHPFERKGAHTVGANTHGAAICLPGDYSNTGPTSAQMDSVAWLLREWKRRNLIDQPRLKGGHRDAPGNSTACPGNAAHRQISEINRRAARGAPTPGPEPTVPDWQTPTHMRAVQGLLNAVTSAGLVVDGIRGPATEAATLAYQQAGDTWGHTLTADGSPGPLTRTALEASMSTLTDLAAAIKTLDTKVEALNSHNVAPATYNDIVGNQAETGHRRVTRSWVDTLTMRRVYNTLREVRAVAAQVAGVRAAVEAIGEVSGMDKSQVHKIVTDAVSNATVSIEIEQEEN